MERWFKIAVCMLIPMAVGLFPISTSYGTEVGGTQAGIWTLEGSPYIVTSDITVPRGMTLKIEAGVVVKFSGYFSIIVNGALQAEGLLGKRIIFTSIHDKEFGVLGQPTSRLPTNRDWAAIQIASSSNNTSKLDFSIIRYSDKIIAAESAEPTINQVIIADCQASSITINGRTLSVVDGNELNYIPVTPPPPAIQPLMTETANPTPFQEVRSVQQEAETMPPEDEFTFGEITVVSAAKQEQKLRESPANVTVITADEIKKMGYIDIVELLRDVVGMDVNDPGQGQLDVGMRGINDRMSMGKHFQMLLDGHDMGWKQFYRNHISTAWIALDAIDRIEIVRGPSSALWGANAFLGTINIITKSPDRSQESYASFMRGAFDSYYGNLQVVKKIGTTGGLAFFTSQHRDNVPKKVQEWSNVAKQDVLLTSNDRNNQNIYFTLKYGQFSLIGHVSRADAYQSISSFSVGANHTRFVMDKKYVILGWQRQFEHNVLVKISGYYDYYNWGKGAQYENNPFSKPMLDPGTSSSGHFVRQMDARDDVFGFQGQVNFRPSSLVSLVLGFDYEKSDVIRWYYPEVWQADSLDVPKFSTNIKAAYLQGDFNPLGWLKLTAGIRHDVHSVFKEVTNQRVALVLTPLKNFYIKALYGTAFKAPSIHELYYFRKNAYYGNPDIQPEKNNTLEMQLGYALGNVIEVNASLFKIDITDIIAYQKKAKTEPLIGAEDFPESQLPDGTKDYNQQVNLGQWESQGIEGEIKFNFGKQWQLYTDATYRKPQDAISGNRLNYTSTNQGRMGLRYLASNKVYLTFQARYVGNRSVPKLTFNEPNAPWQVTNDPTTVAPDYVTLDFALYYPNFIKGLDLSARIVNLLDNDLYDAGREVLFSSPSRAIFMKVGYHF